MSAAANLSIRIGRLAPTLDAYLADRSRVSLIRGPLGSAKTSTTVQKILAIMSEQQPNPQGIRPTRFFPVRNTYRDLESTTIKDFRTVFRDGVMGQYHPGNGPKRPHFLACFRLPDGTMVRSEVEFIALDKAQNVADMRGLQGTAFWLNETKELQRAILDMADLRHGRYPSMQDGGVRCGWHGILGDYNSPDKDHYLYKLAEETRPEGWAFFAQPGGVLRTGRKDAHGREIFVANPDAENLENLPDGYYEIGMRGKDEDWIAVNLANEYGFTLDGKPVHPEFIDSIHTAKDDIECDPSLPLILGVDFGRTPAAAFMQYRPAWGRFEFIDEFVAEDMSQAVFGPELRRYINTHYAGAKLRAWSDPAGESKGQATEDTPRQVLVAAGIPCQPAPSNSVTLRRAALANPLRRIAVDGRPGMLVSPKCRRLRKALAGGFCFRRIKVDAERYTDEPDKNEYSHIAEAAEYAALGEGEGVAALRRADCDDASMQIMADM